MRDYASGYTLHHRVRGLPDRRRADTGSPRGVLVPQFSELPSYRAIVESRRDRLEVLNWKFLQLISADECPAEAS